MKKLTFTQWLAFIAAVIGMVLEANLIGDSEIVNEWISKILIILGVIKMAYDLFLSYGETDVVDFIDYNNFSSKSPSDTRTSLRNWRDNK